MGGNDEETNLIDLFAKEHFMAHKLLSEENPDEIALTRAYAIMAFAKNEKEERYELTPEEYEEARITFSENLKKYYSKKENHPSYGRHLTEAHKKKISEANKGNKYCVGRVVSDETKKKISEANKNPSEETRKKMSESQKARNLNGGRNPRARKVRRISDGKIYGCMKDAANDNNINYSTFKARMKKGNVDFEYC